MIWLTHLDGGLYLVRAESIIVIDPDKDRTWISFIDGKSHAVKETLADIHEKMKSPV